LQLEKWKPQAYLPAMPLYTKSLPANLPLEIYTIEQSNQFKQAYERWFIFTVRDALKNIIYIYETRYQHRMQINQGHLYRASEYPEYCVDVIIAPINAYAGWNMVAKSGQRGRPIGLTSVILGTHQVVENPDRKERLPWGPRRFLYGGRQFVWRQENKYATTQCEDLYEFSKTWPQPGSKTGKNADDSSPQTKIAWGGRFVADGLFSRPRFPLTFVGGLDQAFKEHCIASQCTRMAVIKISEMYEKNGLGT
jgi:hypothetical protein